MLGLAPRPVPPHVVALDGRRLRYARVERRNGSLDLEDYRQVELEPELFTGGPLGGSIAEGAAFRERLGELLEGAAEKPEAASLVLPDAWLRIVFLEAGEVPRSRGGREEVLRWKLRRLIPFRVEDLRLDDVEVPPLGPPGDGRRLLVLFGFEPLLEQLEREFEQQGVRLGHISNLSLSLLEAVAESLEPLDLAALVQVQQGGYTLTFLRHGVPALYRSKVFAGSGARSLVSQDLRLTRSFLTEQLDGSVRLRRLLLACPRDLQGEWIERLEEIFQLSVSPLGEGWIASAEGALEVEPHEIAPLFGAASRSVG